MNKKHLLWYLVAANVLFSFASVGAEGFFGWTLPPSLAAYHHDRFTAFTLSNVLEGVRLLLLAVTCLVAFTAWISLASFWRHARGLFLFSIGLGVFYELIAGPQVTTSIGAAFRMMDSISAGAIIGLVYFSDLARAFERRPVAEATSPTWHGGADPA
jgi:hypothetical protein